MPNTDKSTNARIKWLLIAGSLFVAVGLFLVVWVPYQRQMRLIEEIEAMEPEWVSGVRISGVSFRAVVTEPVGPVWLREVLGDERMKGFDSVVAVRLFDAPIDDAWLKKLGRLSDVRELYLNRTQNSDDGLKHLARLNRLTYLSLFGTQISDDGLTHLAELSNLRVLNLGGTQISNNGLQHLAGLTSLQTLSLDDSQISDDGLKHLAGLSNLSWLYLIRTQVSDDGVKKLQQALPDCRIEK